jgi:hypothetical protein
MKGMYNMKTKPYKGYIEDYTFDREGYYGRIHEGDLDLRFASVNENDIQRTFERGIDDYLKYKHDSKCYVKLINWIRKVLIE